VCRTCNRYKYLPGSFTTYQRIQKVVFCDVSATVIINLYYGNIPFKFFFFSYTLQNQTHISEVRHVYFNVKKENTNGSPNLTLIILYYFTCASKRLHTMTIGEFFITHTWSGNVTSDVPIFLFHHTQNVCGLDH
jgi:hypothetical protein